MANETTVTAPAEETPATEAPETTTEAPTETLAEQLKRKTVPEHGFLFVDNPLEKSMKSRVFDTYYYIVDTM